MAPAAFKSTRAHGPHRGTESDSIPFRQPHERCQSRWHQVDQLAPAGRGSCGLGGRPLGPASRGPPSLRALRVRGEPGPARAGPGPGYRTPAADAARHLTASERGPRSAFEEATAFSEGDAGDLPAPGGRAFQTSTSKERKCRKDGSPPGSLGIGKPHQLARQCSFDSSADDQSRGRSQATCHVPRAWSLLVDAVSPQDLLTYL